MYNFFSCLNIVLFILVFTSKFLSSNPINKINIKNDDGTYNFFVEIPAGTKEKWEVNKRNGNGRKKKVEKRS